MKKIISLFIQEVEIESAYSLNEAYTHLNDAVCEGNPEWNMPLFADNQGKSFRGYVSKENFTFSEFHYWFDLCIPLVEGTIEETSGGSLFRFKLGLRKRDKIAYIIFGALMTVLLIYILSHYLMSAMDASTLIATTAIFLVFFLITFLLEVLSFKTRTKKALRKLKKILVK